MARRRLTWTEDRGRKAVEDNIPYPGNLNQPDRKFKTRAQYDNWQEVINHPLPDMRHEWQDNPRDGVGFGIPKQSTLTVAGVRTAANKAVRLAVLLLGERVADEVIESQARDFMSMSQESIDESLARFAETQELYKAQEKEEDKKEDDKKEDDKKEASEESKIAEEDKKDKKEDKKEEDKKEASEESKIAEDDKKEDKKEEDKKEASDESKTAEDDKKEDDKKDEDKKEASEESKVAQDDDKKEDKKEDDKKEASEESKIAEDDKKEEDKKEDKKEDDKKASDESKTAEEDKKEDKKEDDKKEASEAPKGPNELDIELTSSIGDLEPDVEADERLASLFDDPMAVEAEAQETQAIEGSEKAGIKKLGGQPKVASQGAGEVDISSLWASAPDVSGTFV